MTGRRGLLTSWDSKHTDGPLAFAKSKASGESKDKTDRQGLLTLWDSKHTVYKENGPASLYEHSKPSLGIKSLEKKSIYCWGKTQWSKAGVEVAIPQTSHWRRNQATAGKSPSIKVHAEIAIFRDKTHQSINLAEVAICINIKNRRKICKQNK
ncbi:hypothetical protein MTR_2g049577 [Medicago truncatula]|uniref:Uncharacterized protein n=1 Tax=Medicago truncatula TaxID=3880 RepID=A0A072V913_MEDTR|nr:hypothetical protein MTR_2g049577 [Medicago truncatula]